MQFLKLMERKDVALETKIEASSQIVYPLVIAAARRGEIHLVVDAQAIKQYVQLVCTINMLRSSAHSRLDIEILQLSSLLMTFLKNEFNEYKKNFLQSGWNFLKCSDDKILKYFAYIFTSKFIKIFGIPVDMVLQIYVALLKGQEEMGSQDYEITALSKKALNILIPYLAGLEQHHRQHLL